MATTTRAVTACALGAWLVKTNDDDESVAALIRNGFATVTERCVRPTYRADLVKPGQPVILWISGSSRVHPAGIYAVGHTTGPAVARSADEMGTDATGTSPEKRGPSQLVMPLRLRSLSTPVLRRDLLRHPTLSRIEVLRMPAGSNPSFVTRRELTALDTGWPHVTDRTPDPPQRDRGQWAVSASVRRTAGESSPHR